MNLTTDDLLLIIGMKEAELISLRQQLQKAQSETTGWQLEAQRLQKETDEHDCRDYGAEEIASS